VRREGDGVALDESEISDPHADRPRDATRRDFLRRAGIGAAGVAIGGAAGAAVTAAATAHPPEFHALPKRSAPGFDHIVVVMFENRSFDNMLGQLYSADEKSQEEFDGLPQGSYANLGSDGEAVPAYVYDGPTDTIMQSPQPDPGETYPHVNTQLFGTVDPAGNADIRNHGLQPPFNTPPLGALPDNSGFVRDFIINYRRVKGKAPTADEYRVAMGGFSPAMMPVLSTLAREFAVYDAWHAGVPSQTFCNRLFFHASTSNGYVTNHGGDGYYKWINGPAATTIFNRLEDAGIPWRVYYDRSQLVSLTGLLHSPVLQPYWKSNFRDMRQFAADAENGDLPAYSFIEPRMVFNHNDMHPPWGAHVHQDDVDIDGEKVPVYNSALSDVRSGDKLVQDVYDAIRTSKSVKGSNAMNTALVITFDEHGGTYDHVPPPNAIPPDRSGPGEMGFLFDRLGVRVPAIVVSAYTATGTVIHDEMHHGSVINTLCRQHGLAPLTLRDQDANPIFNAINLTEPRQPYAWPKPQALFIGRNPEEDDASAAAKKHKTRPLTSPAQGLMGLLLARFNPGSKAPTTYQEAYDAVNTYGKGLFGTVDAPE
jgi:phospholipase C